MWDKIDASAKLTRDGVIKMTNLWSPTNKPVKNTQVIVDPTLPAAKKYPGVWTVTEQLPKNVVIKQPGRSLRINPIMLCPAPTSSAEADALAKLTSLPPAPLPMGALVRGTHAGWKHLGKIYVVIKDNGDKVKLAALGGDGGRYWPGVPRAWVEQVDIADVVK